MKVAFIGQKGIPMKFGGIEKHVEELALGLAKRGHDVYAYTRPWYTPASKTKFKGVNLVSLPSIRTKHLDAISHTLISTIDALFKDYDIIHFHGVGPSLMAWIPRLFKPSVRVISTFHCIDRFHQKWNWFARLALRMGEWAAVKFAHDTITVSQSLQQYCALEYGADTIYVPNGVPVFQKKTAKVIRQKFGLKNGNYILFMSRLIRHKGAHYLIDAYNKLKTDKKLVIAGGSAFTDDYVKEIQAKAKSNKNIIFTGNIPGGSAIWQELYSNAAVFVHPSESEGLPIVVLEAMGFGLPVLVSNIPENLEAVTGGFGQAFESRNVRDLQRKLQALLAKPEAAAKMGAAAREHVRKNYNWKDIVSEVEKLYEDALEARGLVKIASKVKVAKSQ